MINYIKYIKANIILTKSTLVKVSLLNSRIIELKSTETIKNKNIMKYFKYLINLGVLFLLWDGSVLLLINLELCIKKKLKILSNALEFFFPDLLLSILLLQRLNDH